MNCVHCGTLIDDNKEAIGKDNEYCFHDFPANSEPPPVGTFFRQRISWVEDIKISSIYGWRGNYWFDETMVSWPRCPYIERGRYQDHEKVARYYRAIL